MRDLCNFLLSLSLIKEKTILLSEVSYYLDFQINQSAKKLFSFPKIEIAATAISPRENRLAGFLLSLGEQDDLIGVTNLKKARAIFFDHVLTAAQVSQDETLEATAWLADFEAKLKLFIKSENTRTMKPQLEHDRLRYFLSVATGSAYGTDRAAAILLPFCNARLQDAIISSASGSQSESTFNDLFYRTAIFIRFFPSAKANGKILSGKLTFGDVLASFESYARTPAGLAETVSVKRAAVQVAQALGLQSEPKERRKQVVYDKLSAESLGYDRAVNLIIEDNDEEDEGSAHGLIGFEETGDFLDHAYERAVRLSFGGWIDRGDAPRADYLWSTREKRVLLPQTIALLAAKLDQIAAQDIESARAALLVWSSVMTGLPPKRLLGLRYAFGDLRSTDCGELQNRGTNEEAPIYLFPEDGLLLVSPTGGINSSSQNLIRPMYNPQANFVPLFLGRLGRKFAQLAAKSSKKQESPFVFPKTRHSPMTHDDLTNLLPFLSRDVAPNKLPLTWSRIGNTARAYYPEANLTPLVYAISSGRPTRSQKTILHYIAHPVCEFLRDQISLVLVIEAVASGEGVSIASPSRGNQELHNRKDSISPLPQNEPKRMAFPISDAEIRLPEDLIEQYIGAAYAPRRKLVGRVWKLICDLSEGDLNHLDKSGKTLLALLRACFALMITAGIREQELADVRRDKVDLRAGLIRIEGKQSAYFREAREVALSGLAVAELERYGNFLEANNIKSKSSFFFVGLNKYGEVQPKNYFGSLDEIARTIGLEDKIGFALRALRHALRSEIHLQAKEDRAASYQAANEMYGRVTMEETVTHQLSGYNLGKLQNDFRRDAERSAQSLLTG